MFVSYAFAVAVIVIVGLLLYYLGDPSEWVYIGIVVVVVFLLSPLNYRYSRDFVPDFLRRAQIQSGPVATKVIS